MTREEWLVARKDGIGASEAAAVLGISPYMSNVALWELKTGRRLDKDISESPVVRFGIEAEAHMRGLFQLMFPQYYMSYEPFKIIRNPEYPFILATPDGELVELSSSRKGGWEGKTTEIRKAADWSKWTGRIPDHYYAQVLHQMLATDWAFVYLTVLIKHWTPEDPLPRYTIRHYLIERSDTEDEINTFLLPELKSFWQCVETGRAPALKLPQI